MYWSTVCHHWVSVANFANFGLPAVSTHMLVEFPSGTGIWNVLQYANGDYLIVLGIGLIRMNPDGTIVWAKSVTVGAVSAAKSSTSIASVTSAHFAISLSDTALIPAINSPS